MLLQDIDFPVCWDLPPTEILRTIETAEKLSKKIISSEGDQRIPGLENSNFYVAYHALNHIRTSGLVGELSFCEWGSGLGVVSCIAAQLGFDATGIEIEGRLCNFARRLATTVNVNAEFIQGSYRNEEFLSETRDEVDANLPFPLGSRASHIIYAYPWPAEETYIETLFGRSTLPSSLLLSFHGGARLRARRKQH